MRSGTILASAMIAAATVFGVGMWYAQQHSYYEQVEGLTEVVINGQPFAVTGYIGTDGETSPLKLRGCFQLADPAAALAAGETTADAVPLTTPRWIECFDAAQIDADLRSGAARGIMAGLDEGDGADLYMAIYSDGRGYVWRQPNEKYESH